MVDDMIFFRTFKLRECVDALEENPDAFSLHLKLSPGLYYSHTNDKCVKLPKDFALAKGGFGTKFLKYLRADTELDWNYPFDFCGSIYKKSLISDIVVPAISDRKKILKPNTFEFAGNAAIKEQKLDAKHPYCLCLNWPVTTVITINKVQDVYNTPVYSTNTSSEADCLLELNKLMNSKIDIDLEFYKR
jgi:hypothetical protein